MTRQVTPTDLAVVRYQNLNRGWMLTKDIAECVPCSLQTARLIRKQIELKIKSEGFESLRGCILTARFLKFMGMSEKKIMTDYEEAKRAMAERAAEEAAKKPKRTRKASTSA
jgi:hypothetical protein